MAQAPASHTRDLTGDVSRKRPDAYVTLIGKTRFIVLLAVAAVMLIAVSLFVLASALAVAGVWQAFAEALRGDLDSTALTVEFLEVVSLLLKAVIFYVVGVGLYSLFIQPLNLTAALGIETFHDLESKIVSVVIVILSVTFLEHFIRWENADDTLRFGIVMALVVASLVSFQFFNLRAREEPKMHGHEVQVRAQAALFHEDEEAQDLRQAH